MRIVIAAIAAALMLSSAPASAKPLTIPPGHLIADCVQELVAGGMGGKTAARLCLLVLG